MKRSDGERIIYLGTRSAVADVFPCARARTYIGSEKGINGAEKRLKAKGILCSVLAFAMTGPLVLVVERPD